MEFDNHPCFNESARHATGRIHLPVAPKCNMQCNYCNRDFDCVNESRPGVASLIMRPSRAVDYLHAVLEKIPSVKVVGIAGPGDPFANSAETIETLELIHAKYPFFHLCVATNGLNVAGYAQILAELGVGHVTVTVNAVDPDIASSIYPWVRYGVKIFRGIDAGKVLLEKQSEGIRKLKEYKIEVKINTVVIRGINDLHVEDISERMAELGADVHNCIPLYHVEGTPFADISSPLNMNEIRQRAGQYLPQLSHCMRCRADAAGLLGENNQDEINRLMQEAAKPLLTGKRNRVAAASMEGLIVNRHLGETANLWIYELESGNVKPVDCRATPLPGTGVERWRGMTGILADCCVVLCSGAGETPRTILEDSGIRVVVMEGMINEAAGAILNGKDVPGILLHPAGSGCSGINCGGSGTGCG